MPDPVTVYDHPLSPYGQKVKIALLEKGVPFEAVTPGKIGSGATGGATASSGGASSGGSVGTGGVGQTGGSANSGGNGGSNTGGVGGTSSTGDSGVTGGASGIGRAIAKGLAAEGVRVCVAARRRKLLEELAQEIVAASERAATLTRQLLAFSRRQLLQPTALEVNDVVTNLTRMLQRIVGEHIRIRLALHPRPLELRADAALLDQVLMNLVVNARDAMPDGGKLTVRTANVPAGDPRIAANKGMPDGDYVLVEVTDTGTGMSSEVMAQIFEPFFSTKEVGKGTGLGLSTVYGIVKQTGGFIYVDSELGTGSTFRIFLPRHVAEKEEKPDAPTVAAAAAGTLAQVAQADLTGRGTVLLVEDEEGLRALNARGLASRGYTVLTAANDRPARLPLRRCRGDEHMAAARRTARTRFDADVSQEMTNVGRSLLAVRVVPRECGQLLGRHQPAGPVHRLPVAGRLGLRPPVLRERPLDHLQVLEPLVEPAARHLPEDANARSEHARDVPTGFLCCCETRKK